ncbi:MAG TPA: outer-membrane lipoprotein carrier protein LolA [Sphingomicrobium sp.]|nr:outer-membrane lipoprotein carrier protein LolA [Sphingomicrobium sp.]
MPFSTSLARALMPAALIVAAGPAAAAENADLAKVRAHITSVDTMTANFVQTDAKNRSAAGTLQLKRPGRIRFQYGSGDLLLVGAGGKLVFLDYTVGQKSSWDLNKTPLGILLSANPDLGRIARVQENPDKRILVIRARDNNHPEFGTLILAFLRSPSAPGGLQLYGWTAIDAQNKRTKVTLSNVRYNVAVADRAFTYAEPKKRRR